MEARVILFDEANPQKEKIIIEAKEMAKTNPYLTCVGIDFTSNSPTVLRIKQLADSSGRKISEVIEEINKCGVSI